MGRYPNPSMLGVGFCSFFGAFLFTYAQLGVFAPVEAIVFGEVRTHMASLGTAFGMTTETNDTQTLVPGVEDVPVTASTESEVPDVVDALESSASVALSVPGEPEPESVGVSEDLRRGEVAREPRDLDEEASTFDITWTNLQTEAPWAARDSGASFVFRDRLWYMGGLNGDGLPGEDHVVKYWEATYFNDVWSSKDGVEWQREQSHALWSPRRSMSVVVFNDVLFMYGGWSQTEGYVSDIWYSVDGYTWQLAPSSTPWSPREGQTLEVYGGKLWLMGGVNYDERKVFNDIWYSEDGLTWSEVPVSGTRWSGRWDHATAVHNGELFLVGGMNLSKDTFRDVWKTSDGERWERVAELPGATRQGHGLVSYAGALWTVGRLNDVEGGGVNDIFRSTDGEVWEATKTLPPWIGREDHAVHVLGDALYVYGGMSADWVWMHDVWKGRL